MKVNGNFSPSAIRIEQYLSHKDVVEIRLAENVKELEEGLYEYDEYIIYMKDRENIQEEIAKHFSSWIGYARNKEICSSSSAYADSVRDNQELTNSMATLVEDIYQTDLNTIGG